MQEYGIYVSLGTLVVLVLAAVRLTWQVRTLEKSIKADVKEDMAESIRTFKEEVAAANRVADGLRAAQDALRDSMRSEVGELGHSLRTHIHQIETWSRDHFVSKETFVAAVERIEKSVDKIGDNIETRLGQMIALIKPTPSP